MNVLNTSALGKMIAGSLALTLLWPGFYASIEPTLGLAIEDQFTVTQVVTSEIAFLTAATDVTMSPSLAGITGGTSNGGTQVVVYTNDSSGYNMTLKASSSPAMQGNSQGGTIPNYVPASNGVPDFTFSVPANSAEFAYTVEASTTADLDQSFLDNGSTTCDTGSSDTADACWLNATSTAAGETIINRTSETSASGSTTTIKFRIQIQSNPVPSIPEDSYTATTTLTAVSN